MTRLRIRRAEEVDPGNALRIRVDFLNDISPASNFALDSLLGFLDLDIDQNGATGGVNAAGVALSNVTYFGGLFMQPPSGLGIEFYVDLGSELLGEPGSMIIWTLLGFGAFGARRGARLALHKSAHRTADYSASDKPVLTLHQSGKEPVAALEMLIARNACRPPAE